MPAACGEFEVFACLNRVSFTLIADNAFAVKSEDQRFAGSGVFGKSRAVVKAHNNELHLFIMSDVHIDNFAFLIRQQLCEFEYFSYFDCIIHSVPPDCNFYINRFGIRPHSDGDISRRQDTIARFERENFLVCIVLFIDLEMIYAAADNTPIRNILARNLIKSLAKKNLILNQKVRILSQKSLRDRIFIYLRTLPKDKNGYVRIPFTQTALAEYLGVNRSALSRELGRMQNEGLLVIDGKKIKITAYN